MWPRQGAACRWVCKDSTCSSSLCSRAASGVEVALQASQVSCRSRRRKRRQAASGVPNSLSSCACICFASGAEPPAAVERNGKKSTVPNSCWSSCTRRGVLLRLAFSGVTMPKTPCLLTSRTKAKGPEKTCTASLAQKQDLKPIPFRPVFPCSRAFVEWLILQTDRTSFSTKPSSLQATMR